MEESKYIGDLIKQTQNLNEFSTERLEEEQSIRDTLLDQTNYLGSQLELKKNLKRSVNSIYDIQSDILNQENQILGTRESYLKIQKNIDKIDRQINSLERDKESLLKHESKISNDIINSINQQVAEAKRIRSSLKDQAEVSSQTRKNLGVSTFQLFSEILANVGGKASQIAKPFEAAAEASRKSVEPLIERNQAISKFRDVRSKLDEIASGSIKATEDLSQKLGLLGKNGEVLTGGAAKEAAANALKIGDSLGDPISKASIHAKGLQAGAMAIGPVLMALWGPLGIITGIATLVKGVVNAMFEASQMTADFSNNFLISRDLSRKLYMDSFKIIDKYNQTEAIEGRNMILREDMFRGHEAINESLGLSMNFMTGFDEAMSMDVAEVGKLMKTFDLSEENAGRVFMDAQITGQSVKEFSQNLYGDLTMMGARTGVMMDFNKLITEAANISGRLRHEMGGTVDNIAKSLYSAKVAGLDLEAASGSHTKLLDVYESINNEKDLEQITGKDIDGNRLRELAMYGTQKQLLSAIMSEASKMGGFLNMTRTQQEAFSKMVGISADDIIDMIYKRQEMAAIQKAHAQKMAIFEEEKNRLLALGIDISNEEEFMEKYGISERYAMLVELGASDTEIKKRLMTMVTTAKEEESAAEKFQRAIGILKDKFVRFVGDGESLDLIITRLTDFINSKAVRYLLGTSDKDLINGILEADIDENQGKIVAEEIGRALQNANEDQEVYYDPLTGNITYIDKIDPRSQELRDQLSSLLDPKTGAYALIDEMYLGYGKGTISPLESTEIGRIENLLFLLSGIETGMLGMETTTDVDTSDPGVTIIGKNKDFFREINETFEMSKNTSEEFAKNRSAVLNSLPPELRAMAQTGELQSVLQDILFQYDIENRQEFMNAGTSLVEQGFINVTDIQLENNKLTEQALRNQMDSETLDAAFGLLENRIIYSLSAEATGQAESLSENNQLMLGMFLKNYGGSDEDIRHMKEIMRGDNERFGVDARTREILDKQNFNMQKGKIDFQKYTSQEYEADKQRNLTNVAKIGGGIVLSGGGFFSYLALLGGSGAQVVHNELTEGSNQPDMLDGMDFSNIGKGFSKFFDDFIQSPGQIPQAFQKGELNAGGNTPSNDPIIQLLEKLVVSLEQQPNKVDLDANAIGAGIVNTSTRIGTTVR